MRWGSPQKNLRLIFSTIFSRAKPAPRSAHGSEALSYRKPSRTYFPAPSFRKTEQGAPPPGGGLRSEQAAANDTVIPYADTASPAHCSRWNKAPGRRRTNITRDASGKPSDARPPAFTAWAFIAVEQTRRDRLFSRRRPFPRCRVHDALLSRSHASLAPRHISPAINRKKQQRCALPTALCLPPALPRSAARRSRLPRAANSAQSGASRLTAPAVSFFRFTRQKRARRPESSRRGRTGDASNTTPLKKRGGKSPSNCYERCSGKG